MSNCLYQPTQSTVPEIPKIALGRVGNVFIFQALAVL